MNASRAVRAVFSGSGAILPVFILAHFSHHVIGGALVPLLPMLRDEMGLNYSGAGTLTAAFTLSYSIMQIPTAWAGNRFSRRKLIAGGLMGLGTTSMVIGLGGSYWALVGLLIVMGVFGSTYHALASAFLSLTFTKATRGRSFGLHTIGGSGSLLVTPLFAVLLATAFGTWRAAFLVLGVLPILVGFTLLIAARAEEQKHQRAVAAAVGERISLLEIARLLGVLIAIAAVMSMLQTAVMSFLPLYLVDKHGVSNGLAGIVVGLATGGGVVGAPVGGALSDRLGRKPVIMFSLALSGPLLYLLTLLPFGAPMLALITVYGMVLSARMPVMESIIADLVPVAQRGTALGFYFFLTQETSAVVTPVLGSAIDAYGADASFTVLAAIGVVAGALALLLRGNIGTRTKTQPPVTA